MELQRIEGLVRRIARDVKATRENYDSVAEMPRGLQMQFGGMLDGGEVEVEMSPSGMMWVSDLSENSVLSYKGRMMIWFKYGGPGLHSIKKMDSGVLVDYFNDQIRP